MNTVRKLLSRETARKGTVTLADQAVPSGTNFFTSIIIGRTLAKEEFGLYLLGLVIVEFVLGLQTSLISAPYTVYSPRLNGRKHAIYAGSTLIHQFGLSALATFALSVTGFVLSSGVGPQSLAPVVWTLVFVITFMILRDYARRVCFASLRMRTALVLDSCIAVVQICGLLLLSHLGLLSVSYAYGVVGLACGLVTVSWLIYTHKQFILKLKESFSDLAMNWSFGKWLFAAGVAYTASGQIYPWILSCYHGIAATGELSACMGVLFIANPFLIGMGNFFGPKAAHAFTNGGAEKLLQIVIKGTIVIAVIMGLFSLIMLFFGDWFVVIIYGNKYQGVGLVVGLLALGQLAPALVLPVNSGLLALERPDVRFKSYLLALTVTLVLGLWLVKVFSLTGVACAILVGNLSASIFQFVVFKKQIKTRYRSRTTRD